jgi:hypothetical protein
MLLPFSYFMFLQRRWDEAKEEKGKEEEKKKDEKKAVVTPLLIL